MKDVGPQAGDGNCGLNVVAVSVENRVTLYSARVERYPLRIDSVEDECNFQRPLDKRLPARDRTEIMITL